MKRELENLLVTGEVYHIFTKSIAGFKIFNNDADFSRMLKTIGYYQKEKPSIKFSKFINYKQSNNPLRENTNHSVLNEEKIVEIIAYCIMPTHLHLILKQLKDKGISTFMNNILNSYSRYFNIKHNRKGPLWESRFKKVLVENDEQLIHLSRYIHLNPVTAYIVNRPEEWIASSYREYLSKETQDNNVCNYDVLDIHPDRYRNFVEDRIAYQKDLARIKDLFLD